MGGEYPLNRYILFPVIILLILALGCSRTVYTESSSPDLTPVDENSANNIPTDGSSTYWFESPTGPGSTFVDLFGDTGMEMVSDMDVDSEGNIYILLTTMDFGGMSSTQSSGITTSESDSEEDSENETDAESETNESESVTATFSSYDSIVKINADGSLAWVKRISDNMTASLNCIDIAGPDEIYIGGSVGSSLMTELGESVENCNLYFSDTTAEVPFDGNTDAYACRIDSDCNLDWFRMLEGPNTEMISSISTGSDNSLIAGGVLEFESGETDEDGDPVYTRDCFVTRFDKSDGSLLWSGPLEGEGDTGFISVLGDRDSGFYVSGSFEEELDLDLTNSSEIHEAEFEKDIFLAHYTGENELDWVQTLNSGDMDRSTGLLLDSHGNVYLACSMGSVLEMIEGTYGYERAPLPSLAIYKFSPDGIQLDSARWDLNNILGVGLAIDSSDRLYVSDYVFEPHDFDPGQGEEVRDPEGDAAYIMRLTPDLELDSVRFFGEGDGNVEPAAIHITSDGGVITVGRISYLANIGQTIDYDPGLGVLEANPPYNFFAFAMKFNSEMLLSSPLNLPGDTPIWEDSAADLIAGTEPLESSIGISGVDAGIGFAVVTHPLAIDPNDDPVTYIVYFIDSNDGDDPFNDPERRTLRFSDIGPHAIDDLERGHTYYFGVRAIDPDGNSDGNTKTITAAIPDSIPMGDSWIVRIGDELWDSVQDLTLTPSGDIVVAGRFSGTVDFDQGTGVQRKTALIAGTIFIAKYSESGLLSWIQTIPDERSLPGAVRIDSDQSGNIWLTSTASSSLNPPMPNTLIAKFSPSGSMLIRLSLDSSETNSPMDIAIDPGGNCLVIGSCNGATNLNYNPGSSPHEPPGNFSMYLVKLNSSGSFQWAKTWDEFEMIPTNVTIDTGPEGRIFIAGTHSGLANFDPDGAMQVKPDVQYALESFVIRLDASGNFLGTNLFTDDAGTVITDIKVGSDGFYVTGTFAEPLNLAGDAETYEAYSAGKTDIFVANYSLDGELVWAYNTGTKVTDTSQGISVDDSGNVTVTAGLARVGITNPGYQSFEGYYAEAMETHILRFDPDGTLAGDDAIDGFNVTCMESSGLEDVYIGGYFNNYGNFLPGSGSIMLNTIGGTDGLLIKIHR